MMKSENKNPKNLAASVKARLLNIAKKNRRDFNAVLLQYFQERFLYRLSVSDYKDNLILKGALLFLIHQMPRLRPTKDIDFLGNEIVPDLKNMKLIIERITQLTAEDGVTFEKDSLTIERITEGAENPGVRIHFVGRLGSVKKRMQLDIGFGDVVIGGPAEINFPIFLDLPAPHIKIYSLESSIAEKFQAIVKYNFLGSRMKDYYDILYLAQHHSFQLNTLHAALAATFKNRQTLLNDRAVIFGQEFKNDLAKQEQWNAFLNRNKLEEQKTFDKVVERLEDFLEPACHESAPSDDGKMWNTKSQRWI